MKGWLNLTKLLSQNGDFSLYQESPKEFILVNGYDILCWYEVQSDNEVKRKQVNHRLNDCLEIEPWVLGEIQSVNTPDPPRVM